MATVHRMKIVSITDAEKTSKSLVHYTVLQCYCWRRRSSFLVLWPSRNSTSYKRWPPVLHPKTRQQDSEFTR